MTRGVTMPAVLPNRLKMLPDRPVASRGAASDITAQPSEATPLPKKATAIKDKTKIRESVKLHARMAQEITRPSRIGIFRALESGRPLRSRRSDSTPPRTPPAKPARAGSAAAKPASVIDRPRALIRYTGNQVAKK